MILAALQLLALALMTHYARLVLRGEVAANGFALPPRGRVEQ